MYDAVPSTALQVADRLHTRVQALLAPLLTSLDARMDRRLVRTLVGTVEAILCFRSRAHGLL